MSLLTSLRIVASAYGQKYGVNVIPSDTAYTDGNNIYTVIDEANPQATWGFLTHEASHVRYTNFSCLCDARERLNQETNLVTNGITFRHLKSLINAFEDNRIEYSFYSEYCGAFKTFNDMNALLIQKNLWVHKNSVDVAKEIFSFSAYYASGVQQGLNYPSCKELSASVDSVLSMLIDDKNYQDIKSIVLASVKAKSTEEIIDLAFKVLVILVSLIKQDSQSPGSKPESKEQSEQEDKSKSEDKPEQEGKSPDIALDLILDIADKGDLISSVLNASNTKSATNKADARSIAVEPALSNAAIDRYDKGVSKAGKLLSRINNLLESRSRTRKRLSNRGRNISKRKLPHVKAGKTNIFQTKKDGIKSETALYVTVDISGSMDRKIAGKPKIDVAMESLSALTFAVSRNKGSAIKITGFNAGVTHIKSFNESLMKAKEKINSIHPQGGTAFIPTLQNGVVSLAPMTKYKRKVVVVITDGDCNQPCKDYVDEIRHAGIEVYCIGIDLSSSANENVSRIFSDSGYVNINKPDELQDEIMNIAHICL